jgi:general secretion pathway protein I
MNASIEAQTGFSLLEVIVAFAIAAVALGVLSQIFGQGARNMALAQDYDSALMLADSLLAEYGAGAGTHEASFSEQTDQFHWTVTLQPYSAHEGATSLNPASTGDAATLSQLMQIDVDVAWERNTKSRSINLSSLRLVSDSPNDAAF